MSQISDQILAKKIKMLAPADVFLAEFEYLYDKARQNDGHIDPNILSAGGFPVGVLRTVLRQLFDSDGELPALYQLARSNQIIWQGYKTRQIADFVTFVRSGQEFGKYTNDFLKLIVEFGEAYVSNLDLSEDNLSGKSIFYDYFVEWESDLGYLARFLIREKHPKAGFEIIIDLHSNSGLFAQVPLKVLTANLSLKRQDKIYRLMVNGKRHIFEKAIVFKAESEFPQIKSEGGTTKCWFSDSEFVDLPGVILAETIDFQHFSQYAYLFQYFNKQLFEIGNRSQRQMYLSSLLNAKAALFEIYQSQEKKYGFGLKYPKTWINTKLEQIPNNFKKFIVKEGGWCSTGGKDVYIFDHADLRKRNLPNLKTTIIQPFLPSQLFLVNEIPTHGHIRKISIVKKSGEILHLGFIAKLSVENRHNSSAYRSVILVFNEEGQFIVGETMGDEKGFFSTLAEGKIKPILNKQKWHELLKNVRSTWLTAIFYLNDYLQGDFRDKTNLLVKNKIVDQQYSLK